jgi:hypothetical protein
LDKGAADSKLLCKFALPLIALLAQVWLFIVAPLIGAGIAGYLFKSRILAAEDVIPERGAAKSDVAPGAPRKRS